MQNKDADGKLESKIGTLLNLLNGLYYRPKLTRRLMQEQTMFGTAVRTFCWKVVPGTGMIRRFMRHGTIIAVDGVAPEHSAQIMPQPQTLQYHRTSNLRWRSNQSLTDCGDTCLTFASLGIFLTGLA